MGLLAFVPALLFLFLATLPLQAEVTVTSEVNRTRLRIGENLIYTLRVKGAAAIPQPVLPPIDGFKVSGHYQTVENTPGGRILLFHYLLSPTRGGRIVVPDIRISIGKDTFLPRGFTAEVETGASRPVTPTAESQIHPEDLILRGTISSSRVYVGEPVIYNLRLLTRLNVRDADPLQRPDLAGFQRVEDSRARFGPTRQIRYNDLNYLEIPVVRYALIPLQPGTLTVDDFRISLTVETRPPISRTVSVPLVGGRLSIVAEALPSPPQGFSGAVGNFTLKVEGSPPGEIRRDQPFSLTYLLEGRGFLPEDPFQWTDTPLLRRYPPAVEDLSRFADGKFLVQRKIDLSLIPLMAGAARFTPLRLLYFDPATETYETLTSGELSLNVMEAPQTSGKADVQLLPLVAEPVPSVRSDQPFHPLRFFLILILPFVVSSGFAAGLTIRRRFFDDPEKARIRRLRRRVRRELARARRNLDVRRQETFHEHLQRALDAQLELTAGKAVGGLTRPRLREVLTETGMDSERARLLVFMLEEIETARFSPTRPLLGDLEKRLQRARNLATENRVK